jgi:hypothetical protein
MRLFDIINRMKKFIATFLVALCLFSFASSSFAAIIDVNVGGGGVTGGSGYPSSLPGGKAVTLSEILGLFNALVSVLYYVAGLIVVGVIVYSGIKYALAGNNPTGVGEAQKMLKAGVIGAFIILGIGVILNTISIIITRGFFG